MKLALPYATFGQFLEHWDGVRYVTLQLLRMFTESDLSYRAWPEGRAVGELFHHIGGHQYYGARGVLTGRWEPQPGEVDEDWEAHKAETTQSVERLSDWLTFTQAKLRAWAEQARDDALSEVRHDLPWHAGLRGWTQLQHAFQDEIHHRGQLYVMARLLGRSPPEVNAEDHSAFWNGRQAHGL